eukprot:2323755-Rhodomonas_salina.3
MSVFWVELSTHYDADSKSTRERTFHVFQDYTLRRQRVETISAEGWEVGHDGGYTGSVGGSEGDSGVWKNTTVISHYGRSWGDDCGGDQVLVEDFFQRQVISSFHTVPFPIKCPLPILP